MKCKKRKEILKRKRSEENAKQKITYASISQITFSSKIPEYKFPTITKEQLLKINICVAHAQSKNQEHPGIYAYELRQTFKGKQPTKYNFT